MPEINSIHVVGPIVAAICIAYAFASYCADYPVIEQIKDFFKRKK